MSSAAIALLPKHEWIVILPDHEGVLEKRMRVRPDHLKALQPSIESGFWKLGGAILEEVIKEGESPMINGSIMLAFARSKEAVLEALQEDIYFKERVWDWDKVQIHPVCLDIPTTSWVKRTADEYKFKSVFRQTL